MNNSPEEREALRKLVEDMTARAVERARATSHVGYLSADELSDLVDCKPNQRCKMIAWLKENKWKYEVGASGLPRVARAYHDRKMGITDEKTSTKLSDEPYFKGRP
jgi:hypothetical protein